MRIIYVFFLPAKVNILLVISKRLYKKVNREGQVPLPIGIVYNHPGDYFTTIFLPLMMYRPLAGAMTR